jgi:hypothetical protein
MVTLCLTNTEQIASMIEEVHDWWISLEEMNFDQPNQTLSMPLSRTAASVPEKTLEIQGVLDFRVVDTEEIDSYPINVIKYDSVTRLLIFTFGIPLTLEVSVDW